MGLAGRQILPQDELNRNLLWGRVPTPSAHVRNALLSGTHMHVNTLQLSWFSTENPWHFFREFYIFARRDAWPWTVWHWDVVDEGEGQLVRTQDLHLSPSLDLWLPSPPSIIPAISALPGPLCSLLHSNPSLLRGLQGPVPSCFHPTSIFWKLVDPTYLSVNPPHAVSLLWVYCLYVVLLLLSWSIRKERGGILVFST